MAVHLTDAEIEGLLAERKPLSPDYGSRIKLKPKEGHKERELDVTGAKGSLFRLILRQSNANVLDFSVILAYRPPRTNQFSRLRRYNGKSHEHTNKLEGDPFYDFHIHMATERYQESGFKEDTYAEPTDRFSEYSWAIRCMVADCAFEVPTRLQSDLFAGEEQT